MLRIKLYINKAIPLVVFVVFLCIQIKLSFYRKKGSIKRVNLAKIEARCLSWGKQLRFGCRCATRPINEVNGERERSTLSIQHWCALKYQKRVHVDLSNQKIKKNYTAPRGGAEIGIEQAARLPNLCNEGNHDPKSAILLCVFFLVLLLFENVVYVDYDAPCSKSMHRLPCHIYVFPVITEEHLERALDGASKQQEQKKCSARVLKR